MTQNNAPFFVDNEVIVIQRNGVWIADGHEISHEPTRRLFARSLFHDDEGYQLRIGLETKRIQVEDTAYFVHRVDRNDRGGIEIWVNDEQREPLRLSSLTYRPGRLCCEVTRHGRTEPAKFLHAAYFDLLQDLREDEDHYYLELNGERVVLAAKSAGA